MIPFEDLPAVQRFRRAMRASPEGTRPVGARSAKPIARGDAAKQRQAPTPAHITPARITQATDAGCPTCRGKGWITARRILIGTGPVQVFEEDCPDCAGTGAAA